MDFGLVLIIVVIAGGLLAAFKFGGKVSDKISDFQLLVDVAEKAVESAEQLWESGQIVEGQRFDHAAAFVKRYFPNIEKDKLKMVIESAVYILKQWKPSITIDSTTT